MNFTLPDQKTHHCEHEASQSKSSAGRRSAPTALAGQVALSEQELRQHIDDATVLMFRAYGLFREFGCSHDREEAVQALRIQQQALRARTPDMEREDRQAFEARWDYFGWAGERDRAYAERTF